MLAIIWATKHFRPYFYGQKSNIFTNHKTLTWLMNFKKTKLEAGSMQTTIIGK